MKTLLLILLPFFGYCQIHTIQLDYYKMEQEALNSKPTNALWLSDGFVADTSIAGGVAYKAGPYTGSPQPAKMPSLKVVSGTIIGTPSAGTGEAEDLSSFQKKNIFGIDQNVPCVSWECDRSFITNGQLQAILRRLDELEKKVRR